MGVLTFGIFEVPKKRKWEKGWEKKWRAILPRFRPPPAWHSCFWWGSVTNLQKPAKKDSVVGPQGCPLQHLAAALAKCLALGRSRTLGGHHLGIVYPRICEVPGTEPPFCLPPSVCAEMPNPPGIPADEVVLDSAESAPLPAAEAGAADRKHRPRAHAHVKQEERPLPEQPRPEKRRWSSVPLCFCTHSALQGKVDYQFAARFYQKNTRLAPFFFCVSTTITSIGNNSFPRTWMLNDKQLLRPPYHRLQLPSNQPLVSGIK